MEKKNNPASAARGPLVLALGDSLTAGYGLPVRDSFAAQLERGLQADHVGARVINAGVSGDTSAMALARLPALLSSLREKPDLVIVQLGANDLLRGVPLARTKANLEAIIIDLQRMGMTVLLARMEPPAFLGDVAQACRALFTDLAKRHGIVSHPFLPVGLLGNPALCLFDRVHPNAKGVAAIVEGFLPAVMAALGDAVRRAA